MMAVFLSFIRPWDLGGRMEGSRRVHSRIVLPCGMGKRGLETNGGRDSIRGYLISAPL